MRKATLVFLALGLVVASTAFASNAVRISQVYGNGNNYYNCDYVELFNSSCAPVNIGGWSLQYGSATGTFGGGGGTNTFANFVMIPAGTTIPACGYYLMKGACSAAGLDLPVTPDIAPVATFNGSGTNGKFVLFSDQVIGRDCAAAKAALTYVDMVGYGTTATCWEGTGAAPLSTPTTVLVRAGGGSVDTDVNSADIAGLTQPQPMHNAAGGYLNPGCMIQCPGACCLRVSPGACIFVPAAECTIQNGVFLGIGVPCNFGICAEVPATKTSWGQIKTIYR